MVHARFHALQVVRRQGLIVQSGHRCVHVFHRRPKILHQRAAFAGEVVETSIASPVDLGVLRA